MIRAVAIAVCLLPIGCSSVDDDTRDAIKSLHQRVSMLESQVDALDAERMEREMAVFEVPPNGR